MARPSVRGQIVEAAVAQFHERGYNGCGVKDITDAAGVPKGSFYNHFESKESLALEAIRIYGLSLQDDLLADSLRDPLTRIRDHFSFLSAALQARGFNQGCMYGNFANEMGDQSTALRAAVEARLSAWSGAVAGLLAAAQADGRLGASLDTERMGRYLVNAWEGATLRARVTKSAEPINDFFALALDPLTAG
jgi:TetR/AcrR family transcriptional repressor of nem operon